jgi:DNA-directed RNA polymerase specialized sigma24 family protein
VVNLDREDEPISNDEELTETLEEVVPKELASKEEVIVAIERCFRRETNLTQRLSYTALGFIRHYFFRDTIDNYTSDDVVSNVLEKIISCKRIWNKERFPDILDFIRISMLSYVRNEKKRKAKIELVDLYNAEGELEEWKHGDYLSVCIKNDLSYGLLNVDEHEKLCDLLFCVLKEDVYATFVLEKRLEGMRSNIVIAENLGLEVKEVENALKRIKRKYFEVFKQLKE